MHMRRVQVQYVGSHGAISIAMCRADVATVDASTLVLLRLVLVRLVMLNACMCLAMMLRVDGQSHTNLVSRPARQISNACTRERG